MTINERIKKEMDERGWSIYKLSKLSGISKTAIKSWFRAVPTKPKYDSIKLVAKAFGMTIEELISEQKPENPQKQEMLELWNRLEKSEKEIVIGVMKAILFHNK
ncbi:MAG: helix-turn-helix transcriptional regulator [Firmicutes bacterium]|jgi:DNA-binding helix-turn-helix protein|nr:helix-turn-helix transcriptional regulator [Bacillota bacterium]